MSPESPRPILEEDLHAYADDGLDAPRRREVQDDLVRHEEAARQVASFRAQRLALRAGLADVADGRFRRSSTSHG
jgi:anti-sigma factor RsiW